MPLLKRGGEPIAIELQSLNFMSGEFSKEYKNKKSLEPYKILSAILWAQETYLQFEKSIEDRNTLLSKVLENPPEKDFNETKKTKVTVYLEQEKEDKALAALVLAYYRGQLESDDLMRTAQLYSYNGIPEKAARLIQGWLKEGRLEAVHKTFKLQFEFWHFACEHGPAFKALEKAASLADNGEDYFLLGRLYIERNEWHKARHALRRALRHGIKEEAKAYYLLYR
jgi:tetratricopeptide (TPR) repeat protein